MPCRETGRESETNYMRIFIVIFTMLGAFFLEWIVNSMFAKGAVFIPVVALVFLLWAWRMEFERRLVFALIVGSIMDAIYPVAFGASILACVLSALLCEAFRAFFSNTEARITQSIGAICLLLFFLGMVPLFHFMLERFI